MGVSTPSLWDIECINDELTIYSPTEIRRFCQVLGISPQALFGAARISANELAGLIREHCHSHGITIQQFEEACGWYVNKSLDDTEKFLHDDCSIDGIQDICRELGVDWQRFI
jgi:hypothetical protein